MVGDISIYGQESNTTWRLAQMTVSLGTKRNGQAGPAGVKSRDGLRRLATRRIDAQIAHGEVALAPCNEPCHNSIVGQFS